MAAFDASQSRQQAVVRRISLPVSKAAWPNSNMLFTRH